VRLAAWLGASAGLPAVAPQAKGNRTNHEKDTMFFLPASAVLLSSLGLAIPCAGNLESGLVLEMSGSLTEQRICYG
jgi:hypothetical protein